VSALPSGGETPRARIIRFYIWHVWGLILYRSRNINICILMRLFECYLNSLKVISYFSSCIMRLQTTCCLVSVVSTSVIGFGINPDDGVGQHFFHNKIERF